MPFPASVPFFESNGRLLISQPLFPSLKVVIGGGDTFLPVLAFRGGTPTLGNGAAVGLAWLALNLALDLAALFGGMGMPAGHYFPDIGLRYLLIPIIAAGIGAVGGAKPEPRSP